MGTERFRLERGRSFSEGRPRVGDSLVLRRLTGASKGLSPTEGRVVEMGTEKFRLRRGQSFPRSVGRVGPAGDSPVLKRPATASNGLSPTEGRGVEMGTESFRLGRGRSFSEGRSRVGDSPFLGRLGRVDQKGTVLFSNAWLRAPKDRPQLKDGRRNGDRVIPLGKGTVLFRRAASGWGQSIARSGGASRPAGDSLRLSRLAAGSKGVSPTE